MFDFDAALSRYSAWKQPQNARNDGVHVQPYVDQRAHSSRSTGGQSLDCRRHSISLLLPLDDQTLDRRSGPWFVHLLAFQRSCVRSLLTGQVLSTASTAIRLCTGSSRTGACIFRIP